jgi:hypothetical protein
MSEAEMSASAPSQTPAAVDPLARARREASGALFALAGLQLGFVVLILMPRFLGVVVDSTQQAQALAWTAGFAVAFAGLGAWARFKTLPAAAAGLVLYAVLALANPMGGVLLILLAALLVRAIWTCLKARRR